MQTLRSQPHGMNRYLPVFAGLLAWLVSAALVTLLLYYADAKSALEGLARDGLTVMSGGFGLCGIPENLIQAIVDSSVQQMQAYAEALSVIFPKRHIEAALLYTANGKFFTVDS